LFTNSELFTDACKVTDEGTHYTFEAKYLTRVSGDIDDRLIGGNASAEEQQEQSEASSVSGLDFVMDNRLVEDTTFTKKSFMMALKEYLKELKKQVIAKKGIAEDDPEVGEFMKRANTFFKDVVGAQFKELNIYFGENDDGHVGTCCFAKFHDDGSGAKVYVFKDGLCEEKC